MQGFKKILCSTACDYIADKLYNSEVVEAAGFSGYVTEYYQDILAVIADVKIYNANRSVFDDFKRDLLYSDIPFIISFNEVLSEADAGLFLDLCDGILQPPFYTCLLERQVMTIVKSKSSFSFKEIENIFAGIVFKYLFEG